jgi:hypothetical protein
VNEQKVRMASDREQRVILTEIDELVTKLMNNEREIEVICREKERKKN